MLALAPLGSLALALLPASASPVADLASASARAPQSQAARTQTLLDAGWRFNREEVAGATATGFDDSGWASVTLPHTFNGADGDDGGTY